MATDEKEQTKESAKETAKEAISEVAEDSAAQAMHALPDPASHTVGALPDPSTRADEERIIMEVTQRLAEENRIRVHYYVKIAVSVFLSALLLSFGIPVFMASRMTGSLSYTALGVVLIGFGFILMASVIFLLFKPPKSLGGKK